MHKKGIGGRLRAVPTPCSADPNFASLPASSFSFCRGQSAKHRQFSILHCVAGTPPHPPQCAHWGTFPSRGRLWTGDVRAANDRPYGAQNDRRGFLIRFADGNLQNTDNSQFSTLNSPLRRWDTFPSRGRCPSDAMEN